MDTVLQLTEAFVCANIPLQKVNNVKVRQFFRDNMNDGGSIPRADALRRNYLPKLFSAANEELKKLLEGKDIAIICDETTDDRGRYVVNILFTILELSENPPVTKLVATEYPEKVNHKTVADLVLKSLREFEIEFERVKGFITDNAAYMKKSFDQCLKALLTRCVHVTCFAHLL